MSTLVKPEYRCSQKDLYSIMETAWANYTLKLNNFTAHKAIYNAAYKTTALAAISSAKALPDDVSRGAVAESLRITMVKASKTCLLNFQMLKSYIETAFSDRDQWPIQFKAAGSEYYRDAASENWESLELLNQSAKNYLSTNNALLLGTAPNLNMPAGFTATFTAAANSFSNQYLAFKSAEETSIATAAKISANNACYRTMMGMMKDGQIIFANDVETKKLFVFTTLWDLINPRVAGIRGMVKVAGSNEALTATITIQKEGEQAIELQTDDDGSYSRKLSAGNFMLTVRAEGFAMQTKAFTLSDDGYKTFDFVMMPE